jgi:hypothetical protein
VVKNKTSDILNHFLEKEIACSLAYSPDGTYVAVGYRGGYVRLARVAVLK